MPRKYLQFRVTAEVNIPAIVKKLEIDFRPSPFDSEEYIDTWAYSYIDAFFVAVEKEFKKHFDKSKYKIKQVPYTPRIKKGNKYTGTKNA